MSNCAGRRQVAMLLYSWDNTEVQLGCKV